MGSGSDNWVGMSLSGGRYRVEKKLGEGGMGFVYRAHDRNLDCDVVIKVPRRAMLEEPEFAGRFAREIRSLVQLVHPNIVRVVDVGEEDGVPFSVMQYLSGGNLRERQGNDPAGKPARLQPHDLKTWLDSVATALDFIHKQDYIHRDVKPENILFDQHGHAYLSDFGIAKAMAARDDERKSHRTQLTGTGMVLGTAAYMAPEVLLGKPYDGSADQYALGVTLYELLAGSVPYSAPTPAALVIQQTTEPLRRLDVMIPSLPKGLAAAVQRALEPDPSKRYADCRTLAKEVLTCAAKAPSVVTAPVVSAAAPELPAGETPAKIPCPHCGRKLGARGNIVGKRVRCPACKQLFTMPGQQKPAKLARQAAPSPLRPPASPGGETQDVKEVFQDAGVHVEAERIRVAGRAPGQLIFEYDDQRPRRSPAVIAAAIALATATIGLGAWGTFALVGKGRQDKSITHAPAALEPEPGVTSSATPSPPPPRRPRKEIAKSDAEKEQKGKLLASGKTALAKDAHSTSDETVRVVPLPANVSALGKHPDRVCAVGFAPDGARCFSASTTQACVWNRAASPLINRIDLGVQGLVAAVLSTETGRLLGATGQVDASGTDFAVRQIHLWDLYTGAKLKSIALPEDAEACSIAISPDGRRALTGANNGATLWNLDTGQPVRLFSSGSKIQSVLFSPKGDQVLCAGTGIVTTWDAVKGGRLQSWRVPSAHWLAPTPDARRFLAGGDTLITWDVRRNRDISHIPAPRPLLGIAMSADGRFAAAADGKVVRLWAVDTNEELQASGLALPGGPQTLAFSPDGTNLIVGCSDGAVLIWRLPEPQLAAPQVLEVPRNGGQWIPLITSAGDYQAHWRPTRSGRTDFDPVLKAIHVSSTKTLGTLTRDGPWKELSFRMTIRKLPSGSLTLRFGETALRISGLEKTGGPVTVKVRYNRDSSSFEVLVDGEFKAQQGVLRRRPAAIPPPDRLNCRLDSDSSRSAAEIIFRDFQLLVDE